MDYNMIAAWRLVIGELTNLLLDHERNEYETQGSKKGAQVTQNCITNLNVAN
jgi:hypothetical protein